MSVEDVSGNKFTEKEQSMNYKKIIGKGNYFSSTKEFIVFTNEKGKHIKVNFLFDWSYDTDGVQDRQLYNFSGHGRYREETKKLLEKYCKQNFPNLH
jgi:hypothetical protein